MTKATPQLVEIVTQRYLHANTMDHIVQETGLSKGTVFKIIKIWEEKIGGTELEEIRAFISLIKKSEITLQECALGFRIANMLKSLEIRDEFDEETKWSNESNNEIVEYIDNNQIENKKAAKKVANPILNFLENVYLNCKRHDIHRLCSFNDKPIA